MGGANSVHERVVFLDVDGVLNSTTKGAALDPELVGRLRALLAATNASLVLSSSWRHSQARVGVLTSALRDGGIDPGMVVGHTPSLPPCHRPHPLGDSPAITDAAVRVREVCAYAQSHSVAAWVCVDDLDLAAAAPEGLRHRFVQTDARFGLRDADVQQATHVLAPGRPAPTRTLL